MNTTPLSAAELMAYAIGNLPVSVPRVMATFAARSNWVQIYEGRVSPAVGYYQANPCEWAFIGPVRPPYELGEWGVNALENPVVEAPFREPSRLDLIHDWAGRHGLVFHTNDQLVAAFNDAYRVMLSMP